MSKTHRGIDVWVCSTQGKAPRRHDKVCVLVAREVPHVASFSPVVICRPQVRQKHFRSLGQQTCACETPDTHITTLFGTACGTIYGGRLQRRGRKHVWLRPWSMHCVQYLVETTGNHWQRWAWGCSVISLATTGNHWQPHQLGHTSKANSTCTHTFRD